MKPPLRRVRFRYAGRTRAPLSHYPIATTRFIERPSEEERGLRRLRLAERLLKPFDAATYGHAHENAVLAVETAQHADAAGDDADVTASNIRTFVETCPASDRKFAERFAFVVWLLRHRPKPTKH